MERERQADIARAQQAERDEAARIERERMAAEQRRIDQDKADLEAERQRLAKEREAIEAAKVVPTPIRSTDQVPAEPGLYIVTDVGDQPAAPTLVERLRTEAGLCRNDGAGDIAALLDEAANALTASESLLALTNEALAACQAQAAGKIRELEARLRAARYDDEIDDGDMIDDEQDGHCDCGALHSEGTEESDSGQCSACGGAI